MRSGSGNRRADSSRGRDGVLLTDLHGAYLTGGAQLGPIGFPGSLVDRDPGDHQPDAGQVWTVGSWRSTIAPMIVANIGSSASISANVAEVNPRALGYQFAAIARVSPLSGHVHPIPDIARQTPEITECYRITGEDCYFMWLHLRSIDDLEPILDRFVAHGRITTSIVHSAPVQPRPLPVGPTDQPPME